MPVSCDAFVKMIGFLRGELIEVSEETAHLDIQGVGYEVFCSQRSLAHLQEKIGETLKVWTYTHVREDILQLFGFLSAREKLLFLSLLKVNGVGPKLALNMLSGASIDDIENWINTSDAKALSALPKVGKKTAEQMILTLKGKLVVIETPKATPRSPDLSHEKRAIASALLNLGFRANRVEEFVRNLPEEITLEQGVRRGLVALAQSVEL